MPRRRRYGAPPKPFDQAFPALERVERNVIARVTDVRFTAEDLVRWMFPDHLVDTVKKAYPFVRNQDQGTWIAEQFTLPIDGRGVQCTFTIKADAVGMLVPEAGCARNDEGRVGPVLHTVTEAYREHVKFEKVRQVLRWLNENATAGAARHYCPWLTSLLPSDHAFNQAAGHIFREPLVSMTEIVPVMRECGAIMAAALLSGQMDSSVDRNIVRLHFRGVRDRSDTYQSEQFGLI